MPHLRLRRARRRMSVCALVALATAAAAPATVRAANDYNTTIHVTAAVETSPCVLGDVLNLSGDMHILMTSTSSGGGYHMTYHFNSQLSGYGLVTGLRYVNSTDEDEEWFAGAPYPVVHTHTYNLDMLSQSGADNYVVSMTMHETVNAFGVPTATVDRMQAECRG